MEIEIRAATPEDLGTVNLWRAERDVPELPASILPKCGMVATDIEGLPVAAAWLYMDNSVGVCWLEWLSARPGTSLAAVRNAFGAIIAAMKAFAAANDYGVMIAHAEDRAMSRLATGKGFHLIERPGFTLLASTAP